MIFNVFFAVCAIFFQVHYHFLGSFALDLSYYFGNVGRNSTLVNYQVFSLKKNSLTSAGHAGNLPYANKQKIEYVIVKVKTNSLTWWFCLKIAVFCKLLN